VVKEELIKTSLLSIGEWVCSLSPEKPAEHVSQGTSNFPKMRRNSLEKGA
jgi:hypothetical protein